MKKVYVVTIGHRKNIEAIFDSLKLAETFINSYDKSNMLGNFNEIEEWEINRTSWGLQSYIKPQSAKLSPPK